MKKKDVELIITVITLRWFRDIQTEIETFFEKEGRACPMKYVQVFLNNSSSLLNYFLKYILFIGGRFE